MPGHSHGPGANAHSAECPEEPRTALRPRLIDEEIRDWLVGTWRSFKLDCHFHEWQGTAQIELIVDARLRMELVLVSTSGKRSSPGDAEPGFKLDARRLWFGPIGSGLPFCCRRSGNVLVLDLDTDVRVHAELLKVGDE